MRHAIAIAGGGVRYYVQVVGSCHVRLEGGKGTYCPPKNKNKYGHVLMAEMLENLIELEHNSTIVSRLAIDPLSPSLGKKKAEEEEWSISKRQAFQHAFILFYFLAFL